MGSILRTLAELPPVLTYLLIGGGAALENIVPPIPADTFVLLGAFLSVGGRANPWLVLAVTLTANIGSALAVYALARKYGQGFFARGVGHFLLRPHQLERIGVFYQRWGTPAIFMSRFLPAFRAMVPVFAGVTKVPAWKVAPPLVTASAIWYGLLVWLGATAGRNIGAIVAFVESISTVLLVVAGVLIAGFAYWWWRSRREP